MAGRIAGITIEIGGNTTKLQTALKGVNTSLKNTQTALKDVDKLLQLDPKNTDLLKQKQQLLADAITQTNDKLKLEKDALNQLQAGPQTEETIRQQQNLTREVADTENQLKSLQSEYKTFGSVGAQQAKAVGDAMKDVGDKIKSVGDKMTSIGKGMTMKVTAPLVAGGAAAVMSYAEVDKTMTLTNATMGNTAEEAKTLSDAMKKAAANSTYGMSDAATATLNFARAGLTAEEAAAALAPAMNLAAGEGGELDTVSAGLVATMNGFGASFDEAGSYADVFANACNNSALDVNSLSSAMSVAAPVFKTAGYGVNDAALYMGVMANSGIEANEAATALKTGFARLVKPTDEAAAMMDQLGISVVNADGTMKDSVTIQSELNSAFSSLSESEQIAAASTIFGKNQMANWLALINTAPADVESLNTALGTQGTTTQMASDMMSGFGGSIEKLKSSADVAATSLGEALAPTISAIAEKVQAAVDWFNSLDASQQQLIAKIGMVVAVAGPLLVIGGTLVSAIGSIVSVGGSLIGFVGTLGSGLGGLIGKLTGAGGGLSTLSTAAGSASAPVSSAGGAVGTLSQNALGLVAAGAGILLASAGLALLANAAIQIAAAGPGAAVAMVGLVAAIATLALGAAALAPALTAGAAGLAAFGAAVLGIGAGIGIAAAGMSLLAAQMPTLATHGMSGAAALVAIGAAMTVTSAGAVVLTAALVALAVPFVAVAVEILATDVALVTLLASFTLATAGAALLASGLLLVEAPMSSIADMASTAGTSLQDMVGAIDIVDSGLKALGSLAEGAVGFIVGLFEGEAKTAVPAATALMITVSAAVTAGMLVLKTTSGAAMTATTQRLVTTARTGMTTVTSTFKAGLDNTGRLFTSFRPSFNLTSLVTSAIAGMSLVEAAFRSSLNNIQSMFANTTLSFNQNIALPHFSMSGKFDAETGQTPTVGVQWYRKAYDDAYLLNGATIFGAMGGQLLGGGEGNGSEMVVGTDYLMSMIRKATAGQGNYTQNVTINSPTALSASEVARQTKNATRQMVLALKGR